MNSLSALLVLTVPLALQQPGGEAPKPLAQIPYAQGKAARVKAEEVMLTYYRTRTHANNVSNALNGIYDSHIRVEKAGGGGDTELQRWTTVDDYVLMIRDTTENARRIITTAREMEDLLDPPPTEGAKPAHTRITQIEYRPRALSAGATLQALAPYQRLLAAPAPPGGTGEWIKSDAIHQVPERNVLVIRELPERIDEIREFLGRIDVPSPQVDIAC
jgi:type II secretory pathway component GspD/PulD (secretin)